MSGKNPKSGTALITGGTTGTGLAIAAKIARPGMKVFLNYVVDDDVAERAARQVSERGANVSLVKENVGSADACRRLIEQIATETDRLDVLVHAAATPNPGDLLDQDIGEIHQALEVGALAMLYLVQPAMKLLGDGSSILFLSGIVAKRAVPHHGAIGISKAVGECLIRYLAVECGPRRINFNTLGFGPVDSPLFRTAYQNSAVPAVTPYGRALEMDDVAEAAAFLLSPRAALIRGQVITVCGGLNITVRPKPVRPEGVAPAGSD